MSPLDVFHMQPNQSACADISSLIDHMILCLFFIKNPQLKVYTVLTYILHILKHTQYLLYKTLFYVMLNMFSFSFQLKQHPLYALYGIAV